MTSVRSAALAWFSLCGVIHMEAPVELGLQAANRIGIGRRPCQECTDRAIERISEFCEGVFHHQPASPGADVALKQAVPLKPAQTLRQALLRDPGNIAADRIEAAPATMVAKRTEDKNGPFVTDKVQQDPVASQLGVVDLRHELPSGYQVKAGCVIYAKCRFDTRGAVNNHGGFAVSLASTGRTLFQGGTVLTLDPHLGDLPKGDVLVEGARIAAVGPDLKVDNAQIVDARDAIVLPGLVDAHRHAWQGALRRLMPNVDTLDAYVDATHYTLGRFYRPEDIHIAHFLAAPYGLY